jgi:hypothetical protein
VDAAAMRQPHLPGRSWLSRLQKRWPPAWQSPELPRRFIICTLSCSIDISCLVHSPCYVADKAGAGGPADRKSRH